MSVFYVSADERSFTRMSKAKALTMVRKHGGRIEK